MTARRAYICGADTTLIGNVRRRVGGDLPVAKITRDLHYVKTDLSRCVSVSDSRYDREKRVWCTKSTQEKKRK